MPLPTLTNTLKKLSGVAKVLQSCGSASFNIDNGIEWIKNSTQSILDTPLGASITLGLVICGTLPATIATRYFNLIRGGSRNNLHQEDNDMPANLCFSQIGDLFVGITGITYAVYSGLNGYLSAYALAKLGEDLCHAFYTECYDNTDDDEVLWKAIIIHSVSCFLAYSTIKSFHAYNYQRLKEGVQGLLQGKWKQYHWTTYLNAAPQLTTNAVLTVLSNTGIVDTLNKKSLHYISPDLSLSGDSAYVFIYTGAASYVIVSFLTNIPAVHLLQQRDAMNHIDDLPGCSRWNALVKISLFLDSLTCGLGTIAAISHVGHHWFNLSPYHEGLIIIAGIGGLSAMYTNYANNNMGWLTEINARYREQTVNQARGNDRLLLANEESDSDETYLIPSESIILNVQEQRSYRYSSRLFMTPQNNPLPDSPASSVDANDHVALRFGV